MFRRHAESTDKIGFMFNMCVTSLVDGEGNDRAAMDFYFVQEDGATFKAAFLFPPYFLLGISGGSGNMQEVISLLTRRFETVILDTKIIEKDDLDMLNHLSGQKRSFLKVSFRNVNDLMTVRKVLLPLVQRNKRELAAAEAYATETGKERKRGAAHRPDAMTYLIDIR